MDIKKYLKETTIGKHEGGYQNRKSDSGNKVDGKQIGTKYGISAPVLKEHLGRTPSVDEMKNLDEETALNIYENKYWKKPKIDKLPEHIQKSVLDWGINSGPDKAIKKLQKLVGASPDGIIGPETIEKSKNADVNAYADMRIKYYEDIVKKDPSKKEWLEGWKKRANSFRTEPQQDTQGAEMADMNDDDFEIVQNTPQMSQQEDFNEADYEVVQEDLPKEPGMLESAGRGFAQGVSFGFADEALAATEAGNTIIKAKLASYFDNEMRQDNVPAATFAQARAKAENDQRKAFEEAARVNPVSYLAGDIAGTLASTAATMGLGSYFAGGRALGFAGKSFLGSMNGFANGLGRSEEDTIEGMATDAAMGAAMGVAGEVAGAGIGKLATPIVNKLKGISSGSFIKFLGAKYDTVETNLQKVGKETVDWAERMVNTKVPVKTGRQILGANGQMIDEVVEESLIMPNMSRKDMLKRVNAEADRQGAAMSNLLQEVDESIGFSQSGSYLKNELYENFVAPLKESSVPEQRAVASKLERYIEDLTEDVIEHTKSIDPKTGNAFYNKKTTSREFNLKQLHEVKSFLQKQSRKYRGKAASSIEEEVFKQKDMIGSRIGEIIDEAIGYGSQLDESPFMQKYTAARTAYGDLRETSAALFRSINEDSGKQWFQKIFNDRLAGYATVGGALGATAGIPYGPGLLAVGALKGIANSKVVNGTLAKSASTLAKAIETNPDALSGIASRLVSASMLSSNDFMDTFLEATSEISFIDSPLKRDPMEVVRRAPAVLQLVKGIDNTKGDQLEMAINKRDMESINKLMSEVASGIPSGYIEEGVGFGGKAYTETDTVAVQNYLSSIKNTRKRMQLTTEFNKNGIVPIEMMQPEQEPANIFIHEKAKKNFRDKKY